MEFVMTSLLFLTMLLLASLGLRAIEAMERENRLVEAELQVAQLYRESLDSRVGQVRRYRHDADGLLRALEQTYGSLGHAQEGAGQEPDLELGSGRCRLLLPDAAIQSKRRLCAEAGIAFACDIDQGFADAAMHRGIDEPDLCIVLQNLLDNAFEASLAVKDAGLEPAMSVCLQAHEDSALVIAVFNKVASATPPDFRTRKANPRLHGVGLQVVGDIARTHGGTLAPSFDAATRTLTMTVRL